ncbi:MAG: SH3 domain-containing protein [Anaerolineaceae bacterium]|nr:SH3 domain-containing protein [Anaerolineaceae bacterium]
MDAEQKCLRVTHAHRGSAQESILMAAGDCLQIENRETDMQGWLWCMDQKGIGSWVPEAYLQVEGDTGISRCDYDAVELTVEVGEMLKVIEEESGWVWCENTAGKQGWVPADCVENDEHAE